MSKRKLGCHLCHDGWRGYNTDGALIACTTCRPHVVDYLERHDRNVTTTPDPYRRAPGPNVPMPDWFKATAKEFARRARERNAELNGTEPVQGNLGDDV